MNMGGAILVAIESAIGEIISSPMVMASKISANTIIGMGVSDEIYGTNPR